jgi:NAD(P)-dependent dehydrogenase (short-subunit alcohol dehydrogenase family)
MTQSLTGVALVTGGGRGIGRAIAERLAADGMQVAVAARTQEQVETVARAIGGLPLVLDVTDRHGVPAAVQRVEQELGPVDLLVNNAGALEPGGPLWEQEVEEWWRPFQVNVLGSCLMMRTVLPGMIARRRGRVVNLSALLAYTRVSRDITHSAYMASKAALIRLTETVAHDARPYGVHVFAVRPGAVLTEMVQQMLDERERGIEDLPEVEWSTPEVAADVIAFIATGALDFMSGRHIDAPVDDWQGMPARAQEILREDLFALRMRR